jgi:hypothetical protein
LRSTKATRNEGEQTAEKRKPNGEKGKHQVDNERQANNSITHIVYEQHWLCAANGFAMREPNQNREKRGDDEDDAREQTEQTTKRG